MTVSNATATQTARSTVVVSWASDTAPAPGFNIERDAPSTGLIEIAVVNGTVTTVVDNSVGSRAVGEQLTYHITDLQTSTGVVLPPLTVTDPESEWTYGPVDPTVTVPRYTTVAAVKKQLTINDTVWDAEIQTAIVSIEVMCDIHMNRSLPDGGTNPQYQTVPEQVRQAALLGALEVFKLGDAPGGVAGSDDTGFLGTWEAAGNRTLQAFNSVKPLLRGFRAPDWAGVS